MAKSRIEEVTFQEGMKRLRPRLYLTMPSHVHFLPAFILLPFSHQHILKIRNRVYSHGQASWLSGVKHLAGFQARYRAVGCRQEQAPWRASSCSIGWRDSANLLYELLAHVLDVWPRFSHIGLDSISLSAFPSLPFARHNGQTRVH